MASLGSEKPGIRHVADLAGVSHMTVSRVLNDHPNIKPDTRRRVLEAIEELDYRPNLVARALATQRTRRIGVIIESAVSFGPTSILRAVEVAARTSGYSVTAVALHEGDAMTPQDAVDNLTTQGVDALCVIAPRSSSVAALRRLSLSVPMLVVKADADRSHHARRRHPAGDDDHHHRRHPARLRAAAARGHPPSRLARPAGHSPRTGRRGRVGFRGGADAG